jgi:soluble lytic murein transglycosylase-like protein
MPYKSRLKKLAVNAVSLVMHFAHGGLLVTGMLAFVLGVGTYNGAFELPIGNTAAQDVQPLQSAPPAQADPVEKVALVSEASSAPLKPDMRAVANYLARRYHVSSQAIKPLVLAAQSAGVRADLDPLLILAVMAIESRFNPFAESVVGAQGLMQVMPRYHQDKLEAEGAGKNALLMEPHMNIQVGAMILRESISRAGSLEAGLQQYAGAPSDPGAQYASKVMAEKQRLEQAARQIATRRSRQSEARA